MTKAIPAQSKSSEPQRRPASAKPRSKPLNAKVKKSGAKQGALIALLKRAKGATIDELVKASAWQPHSVRGFLSGTVKSKLGLKLERTRDPKRGSSYRIIG